jgi:hypothetical protein
MFKRHFSMVLSIAVLVAVVAAVPATAAKPGSGSTSSGPTLTGPAVAYVGESYNIVGSGFAPGAIVPLEIAEAGGCCLALNQVADAYGKIYYTGDVYAPGTYRVRALSQSHSRWRVAASVTFEAYP